jgi:soluble lytic murein transglycosylase-like protein
MAPAGRAWLSLVAAALLALPAVTGRAEDQATPATSPPVEAAPAPPAAEPPTPVETYRKMIRASATAAGMPPEIADAVAAVESGYRADAVGGVGEVGLMQILPSTARLLGFTGTLAELAVPETNIRLGVTYLAQAWRQANEDLCTALMKYRAGHGETRFSVRSVDYCARARDILAARGFTVRGALPVASFGAPAPTAGRRLALRARRASRFDWAGHLRRMRAIEASLPTSHLRIMQ